MAKTEQLSVRMDSDLKREAQALFTELGMDMSTAITVFLRQSVRCAGFPFEITAGVPNEETRQALAEVRAMKADRSFGKSYTDVDTMMKELLD